MRRCTHSVTAVVLLAATLHASRTRADDATARTTRPTEPGVEVAADDATAEAPTPPEASAPIAPDDDSAETTAASEPGAEVAADDAATAGTAAPAAAEKTARPAGPVRLQQIERDLAVVGDEEASTTRFWPILTIALGVAAVATAATIGAAQALSCPDTCHADGWQGVTVMAGAAVATVGVVWLRWTNDDLRELGTRRYRLERERNEIGASAGEPRSTRPSRPQALVLGVRGQF